MTSPTGDYTCYLSADQIPISYTGLSVRHGPKLAWMVWRRGAIVRFCATEAQAQIALGVVQFLLAQQERGTGVPPVPLESPAVPRNGPHLSHKRERGVLGASTGTRYVK